MGPVFAVDDKLEVDLAARSVCRHGHACAPTGAALTLHDNVRLPAVKGVGERHGGGTGDVYAELLLERYWVWKLKFFLLLPFGGDSGGRAGEDILEEPRLVFDGVETLLIYAVDLLRYELVVAPSSGDGLIGH